MFFSVLLLAVLVLAAVVLFSRVPRATCSKCAQLHHVVVFYSSDAIDKLHHFIPECSVLSAGTLACDSVLTGLWVDNAYQHCFLVAVVDLSFMDQF